MQVEWFTDDGALDRLKPEWNTLLHNSVTDTLFLTWEWQTTWWQYLGSGRLCVVTVREDDGALAGILPLFQDTAADGELSNTSAVAKSTPATTARPITLSLVGCVEVSDYLDAIVHKDKQTAVYNAFLSALLRPDFPAWDRIQFCTLPAASPTNTEFKRLAEACGLQVEWRLHDVAPLIELPRTWDEYLERLDKKQRHEVRRKLRRAEEANAHWDVVHSQDAIAQAVADFIRLHRASHPDKHLFMTERMQRFFGALAQIGHAQGWLELEFLELDGKRVAGLYNLVYGDSILVYNSGYDPAQAGQQSPGLVLFARSIQEAIAAGRRVYDFLRGDEEYKYRFGAANTDVYELHLRPPSHRDGPR